MEETQENAFQSHFSNEFVDSERQTEARRTVSAVESEIVVKQRLKGAFERLAKTDLVKAVFEYKDVLFVPRSTYAELQQLYVLHALNHVYSTRDTILKNNAKTTDEETRDQGFTRPKVLVILPTRHACYEFVDRLIAAAGATPENLKRFRTEYYSDAQLVESKPADMRALFRGNNDDNFRIGIKLTRKTVKLFTEFYSSDIIVASALGLRLAIGDTTDKKRDFDFLSSVEVAILDHANAVEMQNWDHVNHIFAHLNLIPTESHGCDFSRVRTWYLDNKAKYLRQTIVLAEHVTPAINALAAHQHNVAGLVKFKPAYGGVLSDVKLRHVFMRVHAGSPQDEPDKRFKYFVTKSLPSILRTVSASARGTLIFVPSYTDYVRVRNHLAAKSTPFSCVCEYTSVADLTRARAKFRSGEHKLLLYTERLHHFRRYEIAGAEAVFMYGLPSNPAFYTELSRMLLRSIHGGGVDKRAVAVTGLYSKWDALKLERIVGSSRVAKMCAGSGDLYEFY